MLRVIIKYEYYLQIWMNVELVLVYVNITVKIQWALTPAHVKLATHLPVMESVALVRYMHTPRIIIIVYKINVCP